MCFVSDLNLNIGSFEIHLTSYKNKVQVILTHLVANCGVFFLGCFVLKSFQLSQFSPKVGSRKTEDQGVGTSTRSDPSQ